jgi:hypothetical protein
MGGMSAMRFSYIRDLMFRKTKTIVFMAVFLPSLFAAQSIWTIGPMLHVNFGDEKIKASFGLEAAYWNFTKFPYSVDLGLEIEEGKFRLYTEAQTGVGVAGISAGPVLEIQTEDSKGKFGFQASVWGNYFLGFDLRGRWVDSKTFFCPGTYVKIPIGARDENGERYEGGSSSYSDWDD